jgi:hypothetical protein
MKQGFFLDRIGMLGDWLSVYQRVQRAVPVFTHTAQSALAFGYQAGVRTQSADNFSVFLLFIKERFVHGIAPKTVISTNWRDLDVQVRDFSMRSK